MFDVFVCVWFTCAWTEISYLYAWYGYCCCVALFCVFLSLSLSLCVCVSSCIHCDALASMLASSKHKMPKENRVYFNNLIKDTYIQRQHAEKKITYNTEQEQQQQYINSSSQLIEWTGDITKHGLIIIKCSLGKMKCFDAIHFVCVCVYIDGNKLFYDGRCGMHSHTYVSVCARTLRQISTREKCIYMYRCTVSIHTNTHKPSWAQ